jgi:histidine ammonia-lyase
MRILLDDRRDITLEAIAAVAWRGAGVELATEALERMDRCHASFEELVADRLRRDPGALVYGVTSAPGDGATVPLDAGAARARPGRLWTAASFGRPLPERVTRAIVTARLANFLGGHAAVRSSTAQAVAAMLESGPLPPVPAQGNGGAGEILALGSLFRPLSGELELTAKERMALINGSPCAAALVADVALAAQRRLELAESVFALAADGAGMPDEHIAPELEDLWGDDHETAALRSLRALLDGSDRIRQSHQAAVSLRILPRMLGAARRAVSEAAAAATTALASVTDNPVYLPPGADRPLGEVYATGGYHNARAVAAIDGAAFAQADLCQLAQRLTDHLFQHPGTAPLIVATEWGLKPLHMVQTGWAEEARTLAQPTLLSLGGFGQNDVPVLTFAGWQRAVAIGDCLNAALAVLAVIASQLLHAGGRSAPPALDPLLVRVRAACAPITEPRALGPDCQRLADDLRGLVLG